MNYNKAISSIFEKNELSLVHIIKFNWSIDCGFQSVTYTLWLFDGIP